MATVLIGTSGWTYASWKGPFYPKDVPSRNFLKFYAAEFPTTEVNYSFYHLPKPSTYERWRTLVPDGFVFAVKASRFITHIKRLEDVTEAWRTFLQNASVLGPHLGPILFQFPPSFRVNRPKLLNFIRMAERAAPKSDRLRLVCEFRHDSWFTDETYRLLQRHGVALCIADGAKYARRDVVTADFTYIRYHGRNKMFASDYTDKELSEEAARIRRYRREGLDVYVYFNNDALGYAVKNARSLTRLMARTGPAERSTMKTSKRRAGGRAAQ
ncbi:MAG TPA: DUF72 domain-containing protein [Nitrospiraceae bacterium]|nr:DUF72 domain-containing protein [Nitrospiraceae bacterium]